MLAGLPYHIIKAANRCDAPRPRSQWHRVSSRQECVHSYLLCFCPPRKRAPTVSGKIDEFSFLHRDRDPKLPPPSSPLLLYHLTPSPCCVALRCVASSLLTSRIDDADRFPFPPLDIDRMSVYRFISSRHTIARYSLQRIISRNCRRPRTGISLGAVRRPGFYEPCNCVTVRETEGASIINREPRRGYARRRCPCVNELQAFIFGGTLRFLGNRSILGILIVSPVLGLSPFSITRGG